MPWQVGRPWTICYDESVHGYRYRLKMDKNGYQKIPKKMNAEYLTRRKGQYLWNLLDARGQIEQLCQALGKPFWKALRACCFFRNSNKRNLKLAAKIIGKFPGRQHLNYSSYYNQIAFPPGPRAYRRINSGKLVASLEALTTPSAKNIIKQTWIAQQPGHDSMPIRSLLLSHKDHRWFDGCTRIKNIRCSFEKMERTVWRKSISCHIDINITNASPEYHLFPQCLSRKDEEPQLSAPGIQLNPESWRCIKAMSTTWWMDGVLAFCTKKLSNFLTKHPKCP